MSITHLSGQDQEQDRRQNQRDAEELQGAGLFFEEQDRGDEGEDQFDLAHRADIGRLSVMS